MGYKISCKYYAFFKLFHVKFIYLVLFKILMLEPKFGMVTSFKYFLPNFQRFCSLTFRAGLLGLHYSVALLGHAFLANFGLAFACTSPKKG